MRHPPEPQGTHRWLTRGVAGIGTASATSDLGHEVATALLPSFLTVTLGAPAAALGVVEGVSDALSGAAKFAGGPLADDPARRRAVAVAGYAATAVLSAGIGAAGSVWQVAVLRAGAWTARGLRVPSRNALLADLVPAAAYGRAYGFERMMDNLGAIGGPLAALALVAAVGMRNAILLSVVPGLFSAAAIAYAVRTVPRLEPRPRQRIRISMRPVLTGALGRLFVGVSVFEAGNVAATLLILRATEQLRPFHGAVAATSIALGLYTLYNVAATLASVPSGRISDRLGTDGPRRVLTAGVAMFALAYAAFAVPTASWVLLTVPFTLAGIAIGAVETAEHAAVAAAAPTDLRGSAFGLLATVQSFGNLAASGVAGVVWTVTSPTVAFGYIAVLMILSFVSLRRFVGDRHR